MKKTYKEMLSEVVIKLGQKRDNTQAKAFMNDFHSSTQAHPFNHNARVVNGNATVHVSPDGNSIHIHDILSHAPKSGAGTKALKHLTSLADKHGVKMELHAKAYSKEKDHVTSSNRLIKWYKKHGFQSDEEDEPHDMTRYPE